MDQGAKKTPGHLLAKTLPLSLWGEQNLSNIINIEVNRNDLGQPGL